MISIVGIVGSPLCVEAEDGQRVYELIKKLYLKRKNYGLFSERQNDDIRFSKYSDRAIIQGFFGR